MSIWVRLPGIDVLFSPEVRIQRHFSIEFWKFLKPSSMEKINADFGSKTKRLGQGLNPRQVFPIVLLRSEKALTLSAEPSELWEGRCIYLISTFILTFSSFLKKWILKLMHLLNGKVVWTQSFSDGRCADKLQETRSLLLIDFAGRGNKVLSEGTLASSNRTKVLQKPAW